MSDSFRITLAPDSAEIEGVLRIVPSSGRVLIALTGDGNIEIAPDLSEQESLTVIQALAERVVEQQRTLDALSLATREGEQYKIGYADGVNKMYEQGILRAVSRQELNLPIDPSDLTVH